MKISLELDVVVAFIKEISDNPSAQTPNGQAFLSAVANSVQTSATIPETHSKKQKQDADKEGDGVYMDEPSSASLTKNKKPKTDCRNAMAKDAAAIPRKIDIMGMPLQGIKSKLRSAGPSTMSTVKADTRKNKGEANQDGRSMVKEVMAYLKEWEWPIMGRKPTWATDARPPAPTLLASRCIVTLSTIKQEDNQRKLWKLLDEIYKLHQVKDAVSGHGQEIHSLAGVNATLDDLDDSEAIQDFLQLRALLHLVLRVDEVRKSAKKGGSTMMSMESIANAHGIECSTLRWRYKAGTRVVYLAAAGGLWLLPMIAVLQLKARLLYHNSDGREVRGTTCADISGLGFALRDPFENDIAQLVREIAKMSRQMNDQYEGNENEYLQIQLQDRAVDFSDITATDALLDDVYISYFCLPKRKEKVWSLLPDISIPATPIFPVDESTLTLTIPIELECTTNPVNSDNREKWTKKERERASKAAILTGNESSYGEQLARFYVGGKKPKGGYILIDSAQLDSDTICIKDREGAVVGAIIRDVVKNIPNVNDIIPQIQAIMPGALEFDDSRRPGYKYTAFHGQFYNRFSESGKGAPSDVHPHRLHRQGKKGNPNQRLPHYGKQVNEDPDRFELIRNVLKPLIGFIRDRLKHILPKEYKLLEDFADNLTMNEDSAAHPLSGFVLNFKACTSAHRDTGDLLICVVIPFGDFEGGELCLFEPGLVSKLRAWDAFVFSSVDITHFNLHYSGVRGSLVLHTDREAAGYTKDYNGWINHIANK